MENSEKNAFPVWDSGHNIEWGLTKREYFAGLAMQGLLSHPAVFMGDTPKQLAEVSLSCADAILDALNSNTQQKG